MLSAMFSATMAERRVSSFPQIAAFGADLEKGIAKGHAGDADGQWQDKIPSPSHICSS